ncbi:MAG: MFS transporter [Pusillimonas sp.]|nr:MAG: MFS transporter [Pusillimonas sp.]
MFVLLYFWEKRCVDPLLPLDMFRNKSLAALFVMSTLLGFAMFAILFYVPLLLQGGFGQTPQLAGLLITPLVMFITVASVFNSRILVRLPNPNIMLYIGHALMIVSFASLVFVGRSTPEWVLIVVFVLGGLGLGFVIPNLTVFGQEIAGRSHLGIATALLQSTRMIGGMLGVAIIGSLVNYYYVRQVGEAIAAYAHGSWMPLLKDPQILMNAVDQQKFGVQLHNLGLDGGVLIDAGRAAMESSIHFGLVLVVLVLVGAIFGVRKVERVRFVRHVTSVAVAGTSNRSDGKRRRGRRYLPSRKD